MVYFYWHLYREVLGWHYTCKKKSTFPQLCQCFDPQFSKFLTSSFPPLPSRWWVSWVTPVLYPPSPSTTFPFPPCTAAWRAPTPSQPAAASALTPSRVWTAWLPRSHTALLHTAPPATAWTPSLQATSTASMARVSRPCMCILLLLHKQILSCFCDKSWSFFSVPLLSWLNLKSLWSDAQFPGRRASWPLHPGWWRQTRALDKDPTTTTTTPQPSIYRAALVTPHSTWMGKRRGPLQRTAHPQGPQCPLAHLSFPLSPILITHTHTHAHTLRAGKSLLY